LAGPVLFCPKSKEIQQLFMEGKRDQAIACVPGKFTGIKFFW
jgi:hypothetical protein